MWPDLAKFRHFGKTLKVVSKFLTVYFLSGKMLSLLWQICDNIGLIFIVVNGQILKNNLTIWSHWTPVVNQCLARVWRSLTDNQSRGVVSGMTSQMISPHGWAGDVGSAWDDLFFFCWLGHLKMSFYYPTSHK